MSSKEVVRFADVAMWEAEPITSTSKPVVHLISMTANPLRAMASAAEMYRGRVIMSANYISKTTAEEWLHEVMNSAGARAPLEFIDLQFFIEGVTRGFTHQLVRQRTAVYVQESTRFAVKRDAGVAVGLPPSIARLPEDAPVRKVWDDAVTMIGQAYNAMIDNGVPAEDARGLLPTNILTRVHYKTNLRNLVDHAGMRLCSQAQYEWKMVWAGILTAIRQYGPSSERWQQEAIANLFKPVCYHTGRCEFMGENDRYCPIRERVEEHHAKGEPSSEWHDINPVEPLMEGAARLRPGEPTP